MFESAELGHTIDQERYQTAVPALREALLEAQYELKERAGLPVIILINGMDAAGKGETVNKLNEWMDPRYIHTHAFAAPSAEEAMRPRMWRFWRALPPKGRIAIFFGSWYTEPFAGRLHGDLGQDELDAALEEITQLEKMLIDDGALILKFWLHLSRDKQKERIKRLEQNPLTRWRVTAQDKRHLKMYDAFKDAAELIISKTSTALAPWTIVEGYDANYRQLSVGQHILAALRERLDTPPAPPPNPIAPPPAADRATQLSGLDLSKGLSAEKYGVKLEKYQGRLNLLTRDPRFADIAVICVFEGPDAAGKGGAIRRITQAVDARRYNVVPVAAPTEEERAQPYLWRFWRQLPGRGRITLFDRSWYGRVLVERVEGFCSEHDWMRAYREINAFEAQLARQRYVVVKFWLQISADEQLARFREREATTFKRYKITDDDWRNRRQWDAYQQAACDMLDRTSLKAAPWTVVEANDKHYARIKILKTLCERIEKAL